MWQCTSVEHILLSTLWYNNHPPPIPVSPISKAVFFECWLWLPLLCKLVAWVVKIPAPHPTHIPTIEKKKRKKKCCRFQIFLKCFLLISLSQEVLVISWNKGHFFYWSLNCIDVCDYVIHFPFKLPRFLFPRSKPWDLLVLKFCNFLVGP